MQSDESVFLRHSENQEQNASPQSLKTKNVVAPLQPLDVPAHSNNSGSRDVDSTVNKLQHPRYPRAHSHLCTVDSNSFPRIPMRPQDSPSAPNPFVEFPNRPPFNPEHHDWLTAAEAAPYLKIKTRTILFWACSSKIKGCPLTDTKRRFRRFLESDLDAILIHSGPVLSSAQPSVLANERSV